jgi:two-component system phosphate regulon response regulator PhoB
VALRQAVRVVVFEERDWERLVSFAFARSGHFRATLASASSSSKFPVLSPDDTAPPQSFRDTAGPVSSRIPPSRVLVVDDDAPTRDLVTKTLQALGLSIVSVDTAEAAAETIAARRFDLVVIDFGLPRSSGLDLVRQMRKTPATVDLPALFIAEQGGSRDAVEAFASGADDFVTKPLRASELSARIVGLLRRARTSQPPERR